MRLDTHTAKRVSRLVDTYDAWGWHRSGTDVERQTCEWLASEVEAIGFSPQVCPYSFTRVEPGESFLEVAGFRLQGLPLFDGQFTDARGVQGLLGGNPRRSSIPVVMVDAGSGTGGIAVPRPESHASAFIVLTRADRPGLAPKNAHSFQQPFGPPAIQLSSTDEERLLGWVEGGRQARVVAQAARVPATGYNLLVEVEGNEPLLEPVVVMTPLTGWWHCAAERGGGIACWLESLRCLGVAGVRRTVIFVGTGGHELKDLGLQRLLEAHPPLETHAFVWLRFGADIGAAAPGGIFLASEDGSLLQLAISELNSEGLEPTQILANGRTGRRLLVRGQNQSFHLIEDRWPASVDVDSLARQATAYARLVRQLADSE